MIFLSTICLTCNPTLNVRYLVAVKGQSSFILALLVVQNWNCDGLKHVRVRVVLADSEPSPADDRGQGLGRRERWGTAGLRQADSADVWGQFDEPVEPHERDIVSENVRAEKTYSLCKALE